MHQVERDRLSVLSNGAQWSLYDDGYYVRELTVEEVAGLMSGRLSLADLVSAESGSETAHNVLQRLFAGS